jgi:hypothetical protein
MHTHFTKLSPSQICCRGSGKVQGSCAAKGGKQSLEARYPSFGPISHQRAKNPAGQRSDLKMMLAQRTTTACSGRRAASSLKAPRLLRAAAGSPKQQQCAGMNAPRQTAWQRESQ